MTEFAAVLMRYLLRRTPPLRRDLHQPGLQLSTDVRCAFSTLPQVLPLARNRKRTKRRRIRAGATTTRRIARNISTPEKRYPTRQFPRPPPQIRNVTKNKKTLHRVSGTGPVSLTENLLRLFN
jgi:hypothetical protein